MAVRRSRLVNNLKEVIDDKNNEEIIEELLVELLTEKFDKYPLSVPVFKLTRV
jgi:hypothetical protein